MVILDTNVVSALMRPRDNLNIVKWLDRLPRNEIWTTAVAILEIRFGLLIMSDGKKRSALTMQLEALLKTPLLGRVAPLDHAAAEQAASVLALRRAAGRQVETADAQIAGIALSRGASLATRNVRDFEGIGLGLVDPWS